MDVESVLGPDGAVARLLGGYEPRAQQLEMAQAVGRAIGLRRHLLAEAGTGVGKSFAYLVPAILAAQAEEECRVVVSTHTIGLQEQLIRKDIPFLQKVFPEPFQALLVKGRGNYLSKRRLGVARNRGTQLLHDRADVDHLESIARWAARTRDGSRSDLPQRPLPQVWDLVESDSNNCLGQKCSEYRECFYFRARRSIQSAQLLVVNHALFFADLALRAIKGDFAILPKYRVVVFDEAHTVEDVAADHLGLTITRGQVEFLLSRLVSERQGKAATGLLTTYGDDASWQQVYRARAAARSFFDGLASWRREEQAKARPARGGKPAEFGGGESWRVRRPNVAENHLSPELRKLVQHLQRVGEQVRGEEEKIEFEAAAQRCWDLAEALEVWLGQQKAGQVYWMEGSADRGRKLQLSCAPVDVSGILKELLFSKVPSVILTSATLNAGGSRGFDHFRSRLGVEEPATLQLGSPFDYRRQVELHLFRTMPDPQGRPRDFEEACLGRIREYVARTKGRAFVLFTSHQALQRAAAALREELAELGLDLIAQSDGMAPGRMLEKYLSTPNPVLFGVDSFWQGVDVRGEALSNVIITKLPFVPPDRPLVEARGEAIDQKGGNAFQEYSLPQAILKLKQGFGRLIRTRSDQGLVVILDPRVLTKYYGRAFLAALPPCRRIIDGVEAE